MTRDQFLTEKMGLCWHEWGEEEGETFPVCVKCHCRRYHVRDWTNITEWQKWDWFGKLWEWAKEQEWWKLFLHEHLHNGWVKTYWIDPNLIHPDRFADSVAHYLGWEETK